MPEEKKNELVLQVQDPDPTHVGRNIVTLDRETKTILNITSGDIVQIEGSKKTAAIVWPARVDDEGKKIIRADSFIRHNAGVALNEKVKVTKVFPQEGKKVILAPVEEVRIIASGYDRILKKSFLGRPLTVGDNVWISVFGSGFIYRVVDTAPRGIVKVTDNTQFSLKEKPVKDALSNVPKVAYEDIGGLGEQVKKVREMVELPMKHPELFQKLGIVPPKGILLYGPPGTGKTLLAKAVANEAQVHFIYVSAPEIMGKFVGEAEERVRNLFKDAQENAPSIIFIDEIDSIAPKRDEVVGEVERRVVAQILSLMDGLEGRGEVIVMAATNRINSIDEALRRPGRFDREIEFTVPDTISREKILNIQTRGMPIRGELKSKYLEQIFNSRFKDKEDFFSKGIQEINNEIKTKETEIERIRKFLDENKSSQNESILDKLLRVKNEYKDAQEKLNYLEDRVSILNEKYSEINYLNKEFDSNKSLVSEILSDLKNYESFESFFGNKKYFEIRDEMVAKKQELILKLKELEIISQELWDESEVKAVPDLLKEIAAVTFGFVGADLQALTKEAAMKSLGRYVEKGDVILETDIIPADKLEKLKITKPDFLEGLKAVQPSALREVAIEIPNIKWSQIGALESVKQELKQAVEWPIKNPQVFKEMGIRPPKGILLYGPPGTGKTLLAKAVATESEANFISIKGPELMSMWVGEGERGVRKIFKKARQVAPCVVFFDEFDAIAPRRGNEIGNNSGERMVNQLLTELDGVEVLNDVVFIAATNRPDLIDPALLRPGRIDKLIIVPAPDEEAREAILKVHTKNMKLDKSVSLKEISEKTKGFSGADLEGLVREAALLVLQNNNMKPDLIKMKDFDEVLKKMNPSIKEDSEKAYEEFKEKARDFKPSYVG